VVEAAVAQAQAQLLVMLAMAADRVVVPPAELLVLVVAVLPGKAMMAAEVLGVPIAEVVVVVVQVLLVVMVC
jgi:hypothetical protein